MYRKLYTSAFVVVSILVTVAAITAGPESEPAVRLPPPGAAFQIYIPSMSRIADETADGAIGKLSRTPALKPVLQILDAILKDESASLDGTLAAAGANISTSDISGMLKGPLTAGVYPGSPGERHPKFCIFIGAGNRTEKIRRALVKIASRIIESGSGEVKAGAVAIGGAVGHKWTSSEYALTLFTAYLKDGLVIANDRSLIKSIMENNGTQRPSAVTSRLFAAACAAKANASIMLDFKLLEKLLKNLPAGGGDLQKLVETIRAEGVGQVVWAITYGNGETRERIAVEGLKLPASGKPVQTNQLKRIPKEADITVLCVSPEPIDFFGEILQLADMKNMSILPGEKSSETAAATVAAYTILNSPDNTGQAAAAGENDSVLIIPRIRSIVSQAPLDACVLAILNLDSVASYLSSRLRKKYGDSAPEVPPASTSFDNVFGILSIAAMPARWGTLVEIRSNLAPGTPIIALTAYTTVSALQSLRSHRIRVNESKAVASLRGVLVAQELYRSRHGKFSGELAGLARERYIDVSLGSGLRSGYLFHLETRDGGKRFVLKAEPVRPRWSGRRTFSLDETGQISEK